jgi:RNA polymerase subunit RPABC4/transcription elongation factor Spt4
MGGLFEQIGGVVGAILDHPLVRFTSLAISAYVVLLWLAFAFWVLQDMRRRHSEPMAAYVAAGGIIVASPLLFPLALIVYRILRPSETLAEARERELTERLDALEADLELACPGCHRSVEEDWLICPACRTRLAHRCASCGRTMGLDWTLCGWCGSEFGRAVLPERIPGSLRQRRPESVRSRPPRSAGSQQALEPGA